MKRWKNIRLFIGILKLTILTSIAISGISIPASSQYWSIVGNLPYGLRYDDICFIDSLTGWTVNGHGRIYKTVNGGQNWLNVWDSDVYFRSVDFINENIGFAGSLDSLFLRTTDGGENWVEIQDLIPVWTPGICGLSHIDSNVYGVGIWSNPAYFIKSEDQGNTWFYSDMSPYANALVDCHFLNEEVGFVSGSDGGGIILKTIDGGDTWQEVYRTGKELEYVWKLFFVDDLIAYGSIESWSGPTTVLKSIDGGNSWAELEVAQWNTDIQGIGFIDSFRGWVSTRDDGSFSTYDGGVNWYHSESLSGINRFFKINEQCMLASGNRIHKWTGQLLPGLKEPVSREHAIGQLSPNPFSDELTIEIQIDNRTYVKMDIISFDGRNLLSIHDGRLGAGKHTIHLNAAQVSLIPEGINILYLRTNEGFLTQEIVKVN